VSWSLGILLAVLYILLRSVQARVSGTLAQSKGISGREAAGVRRLTFGGFVRRLEESFL
jgi:hypothetical protein